MLDTRRKPERFRRVSDYQCPFMFELALPVPALEFGDSCAILSLLRFRLELPPSQSTGLRLIFGVGCFSLKLPPLKGAIPQPLVGLRKRQRRPRPGDEHFHEKR